MKIFVPSSGGMAFDRACLPLLSRRHVFTLCWIRCALSGSRCQPRSPPFQHGVRKRAIFQSSIRSLPSRFYWQSKDSNQSVYTFFESDSRDWRISFKLSVERRIHDDSIGDVNGRFGMFVIIFFFFLSNLYIVSRTNVLFFSLHRKFEKISRI